LRKVRDICAAFQEDSSECGGKYPELVNKTIIDGKLSGDHAIFNKLNNIGNDVNKLNSWINQKGITESLLDKLETLSPSELKTLSLDIEETTSLQNLLKTNPENGLEAWKIYRENLPTDILCK
jgi:hypothetical protein